MLSIIPQDIIILESWATVHGLKFASSKTKLMLFTNKTVKKKGKIYMQGHAIEWVNSYKYLGVTLDTRLNWATHVSNTAKKATMIQAQTRKLMGSRWGPKVSRWSYISIIRPIMSYASLIWIVALEFKNQVKKLNKVQRRALVNTCTAMRRVSKASLEIMTDILPIKVFMQKTAVASCNRLKENGNWKPKVGEPLKFRGHCQVITDIMKKSPDLNLTRDKLRHKGMLNSKFDTNMRTREEWETIKVRPTPTEDEIINCFTDGSKDDKSSGCAYIIRGKDMKSKGYRNFKQK